MTKQRMLLLVVIALSATTGVAQSRQRVSAQKEKEIVQQLIRDREITAKCVQEAGGAQKTVYVNSVDLNRDGKPEFIVDLHTSCGAGNGYKWIYRRTTTGYEQLLSAGGPRTEIAPLKSYTNGYRDVVEAAFASVSGDSVRTIYRFDGKRYREKR